MKKENEISVYLASPNESKLVSDDAQLYQKFITHNFDKGRVMQAKSAKEADIIIIFQAWSFKLPNYIELLCADPLIQNHAEKVYVVNYDSTVREGFLPGCYVSLQKSCYDSRRFIPSSYPKVYNELIDEQLTSEPTAYLFSFRGTLHSHEVRKSMFSALKNADNASMVDNTKAFHSHTRKEKSLYLEELAQSEFVLCPRGTSPNSYRLFETMQLGRCPVIISDEWVAPEGPDWSECSIRVKENETFKIEALLNERRGDSKRLGMNAKTSWLTYFSEEQVYRNYLDNIIQLHQSTKSVTRTFKDYKTYWRSQEFLYNNDWALSQKIMHRIKFWT